jgi:hypothetical protein
VSIRFQPHPLFAFNRDPPEALGGDDGGGPGLGDQFARGIIVIGLIGDDPGCDAVGEEVRGVALSWSWPALRMKRKGRPWASVMAWILVVNPPRERPRA